MSLLGIELFYLKKILFRFLKQIFQFSNFSRIFSGTFLIQVTRFTEQNIRSEFFRNKKNIFFSIFFCLGNFSKFSKKAESKIFCNFFEFSEIFTRVFRSFFCGFFQFFQTLKFPETAVTTGEATEEAEAEDTIDIDFSPILSLFLIFAKNQYDLYNLFFFFLRNSWIFYSMHWFSQDFFNFSNLTNCSDNCLLPHIFPHFFAANFPEFSPNSSHFLSDFLKNLNFWIFLHNYFFSGDFAPDDLPLFLKQF